MNLSRNARKELDALSLEVFGSASRWQKLVNRGYTELVTHMTTEVVPGENGEPDTTKEVSVPTLRKDGAHQSVSKLHTVESVKNMMLDHKVRIDSLKKQIEEMQAKEKAKKEAAEQAKAMQEAAGGSAV